MAWCTRRGPDAVFFSSRRRHTRYWRDGVQTCALPIFGHGERVGHLAHVLYEDQMSQVLEQVGDEAGEILTLGGELLDEVEQTGPVAGDDQGADPEGRLLDRKSGVEGKRVDLGGGRII